MKLGVVLLPTDSWQVSVERARQLDILGYDHLWVYDHLTWRRYQDLPWHSTYPWLAGLAALTEHIGLGTMVANPNIRHPAVLAKDAMTIDHLSVGRFILGIGAGGTGFDAWILGQEPLDPGQRMARLEEFARVVDEMLRNELTDHRGDWYEVNEGRTLPGCVQQPRVPIAVAAGGERGLRLAAELADAWITFGDSSEGDLSESGTDRAVSRQIDVLERHCDVLGRDPDSIDRIYLVGNTEAQPLVSLGAFTDFAGRYAELGFTDLVFHDPRPDDDTWEAQAEIVEAIAAAFLNPTGR